MASLCRDQLVAPTVCTIAGGSQSNGGDLKHFIKAHLYFWCPIKARHVAWYDASDNNQMVKIESSRFFFKTTKTCGNL